MIFQNYTVQSDQGTEKSSGPINQGTVVMPIYDIHLTSILRYLG